MKDVRRLLKRLFRPGDPEAELSREINAHLALLEDRFIAQGMTPADARLAARRSFGGVEQVKEEQRDARSFRWMAGWSMDFTLGLRMLRKTPGLTAIALIALSVGIGGAAAFFEFSNDLVRGKLAFDGGDRLVGIVTYDTREAGVERRTGYQFAEWRRHLTTIESVGAAQTIESNVTTADGRTVPVSGAAITASAFHVIPTPPLHGRVLSADDEPIGAANVAVLGYATWRDVFDSNPGVVGTTLRVGNIVHEVVGVMPEGFGFPMAQSLWTPLRLGTAELSRTDGPPLWLFGKLKKGVSLVEAEAEVDRIAAAAPDAAQFAHLNPRVLPYVQSVWAQQNSGDASFLYSLNLLFIALIGICGTNVATLVFARTITRESEITVRTALGASRGRIVSQMVIEALVLAGVAAAIGLAGAAGILQRVAEIWTVAMAPLPFWWDAGIELATVLYTVGAVLLAAVLIGAVPALKATTTRLHARLKTAGSTGGTRSFGRLWTGVIVTQVAFTVAFLTILTGMVWSTSSTSSRYASLSFPAEEYLSARVEVGGSAPEGHRFAVLRQLQNQLSLEPGVRGVTYASWLPAMTGGGEFSPEFADPSLSALAARVTPAGRVLDVRSPRVAPNYFETFNQRILEGRGFTEADVRAGRDVLVADESFVRVVLGGRSPIGQQVRPLSSDGEAGPWHEIIGVVSDLAEKPSKPATQTVLYRPLDARPTWLAFVIVHTGPNPATMTGPLRRAAMGIDPDARLEDVKTLRQVTDEAASASAYLVAGYGVVAGVILLLATAGIYALVSFTLSARTRELGIRMALGAAPRRMIGGVLARNVKQVTAGALLGGTLGILFLAQGMLDTSDLRLSTQTGLLTAFGLLVGLFVLVIAVLSCWAPLRRALGTDPTQALRTE